MVSSRRFLPVWGKIKRFSLSDPDAYANNRGFAPYGYCI